MTDEPSREIGLLGQYTGLQDRDGKPIHIGHVIRMDGLEDGDEPSYAFGRVWYMAPELCARRVDETTGELLSDSYSLIDWGYGTRVQEFTLMEDHPGAVWPEKPPYYCSNYCEHNVLKECDCSPCVFIRTECGGIKHESGCALYRSGI